MVKLVIYFKVFEITHFSICIIKIKIILEKNNVIGVLFPFYNYHILGKRTRKHSDKKTQIRYPLCSIENIN